MRFFIFIDYTCIYTKYMTYELGKSLQEIVKNEEYVQTFFCNINIAPGILWGLEISCNIF